MAQLNSTEFKAITASLYADNVSGEISAGDLRTQMNNIADSAAFKKTGQSINPTPNDDGANTSGRGTFKVGDLWINETNNSGWLLLDNTAFAAIWSQITLTLGASVGIVGTPSDDQVGVWTSSSQQEGTNNLKFNGNTLAVIGAITATTTVNGRFMATDGAKLDSIQNFATFGVSVREKSTISTAITNTYNNVTKINFRTGDGLVLTNPFPNEVDVTYGSTAVAFLADHTLTQANANSNLHNAGAAGPVRFTIPLALRVGATYYFTKEEAQTMEIIGATNVFINGVQETGAGETLHNICSVIYRSSAKLVCVALNTYHLIEDTNPILVLPITAASYTLQIKDNGDIVTMDNAGANILSILGSTANVYNITGITQANPAVVTVASTAGLANGDTVAIASVGGMVEITDGDYVITVINGTTFSLDGIDSTAYTPYTTGGTATETIPPIYSYPVGYTVEVVQLGAGATTIQAGLGITLNGVSGGGGNVTAQYDVVKLRCVAANTWIVNGDIGAIA